MQAAVETFVGMDKDAARRDKRGRALAAMGHVARTDDGFEVTTAGRRRETFRVWRDETGRVQCTCSDFVSAAEARFRCEHILAVKYYIEPPIEEVVGDPVVEPAAAVPLLDPFADAEETPESTPTARAAASASVRTFEEVLARFREPLPDTVIRQRVGWTDRSGREHEVDYVEWHLVADLLDDVAPRWSHAVRNIVQIGALVAVTASITIDGVTREGIGTGEATDEKGIKKAEHDALKRAAVKFGLARELYRRDDDDASGSAGRVRPDQAAARTIADLVTPKQLVAIRAIANASGVDAEKRSLELFNCRPEELSKRAASQFIDDLKSGREESTRRAS